MTARPDPAASTGSPPPPAVVETHVSVLFFLGDRVYKLRKAVRTGFLDFTTPAARAADCAREVALNRRLAPDVYLGVVEVRRAGEVVDHLVEMRRLPAGRSLASLVGTGEDVAPCLRAVARTLAGFHARAHRGPEVDREAGVGALRRGWDANLAETSPFVGPVLDPATDARIRELALAYLAGRRPLLEERVAAGLACDGHGDLQAADVFCLDDGPRLLDCVEFDDRLRYADVAADVAFLAMDLERLGAPEAARRFTAEYQEASGDRPPASLRHFYAAARAYVRAKVTCLRWQQGDRAAAEEARALHELAARHLEAGRVRLVLVGGAPGSGKSTLASGLALPLEARVLRTDGLRPALGYGPPVAGDPGGADRYGPAARQAVYGELLARAEGLLGQGETVVADATWGSASWRAGARELAARTGASVVELCCRVPGPVADRRITGRPAGGAGASEATPAVRRALEAAADPWPEARVVDTSGSVAESLAQALAAVDGGRRVRAG